MLRVGFPTLHRYDLLVQAILSLEEGLLIPNEYIVVDNGFSKTRNGVTGFADYLKKNTQYRTLPSKKIKIIETEKNWGVAKSWNYLIDNYGLNPNDILIISNDDICFHFDTIRCFADSIVANSSNQEIVVYYCDRFKNNAYSLFSPMPNVFKVIGLFDEKFYPAYFEDCDFSRRIELTPSAEFFNISGCHFSHHHSGTFTDYTDEEMEEHHKFFARNKEYFLEKWGGEPGQETYATEFNKQES